MVSKEDVIESIKSLPADKKMELVILANYKGVDIEGEVVPTIVNIINGIQGIAEMNKNNFKLMFGKESISSCIDEYHNQVKMEGD